VSFRPSGAERPRVGDVLGAYTLEELLGEGAVGFVFRARHASDGATVALKVLKRRPTDDSAHERFRREAEVAREVRHERLVPVLEAGEADGWLYLAMTHVSGGSLGDSLESEGRLPLERTLRVVADVAAGLDALHEQRLVHRDVKPSNILLAEDGAALLTDFGLAKGPEHTVLTRPGMVLGTIDYLAPERLNGEPAGPASDVYSLGCVAYECLVGAPPFIRTTFLQTVTAHLREEAPELAEVPRFVSSAVLWALAKQPDDRPPTAGAYAQLLASVAGFESESA
jgi:serine/threonine protein kinase